MASPLRTCTGCRQVAPKASLVRMTLSAAGGGTELVVGAGPGRGAYVHARKDCIEAAGRGGLARSFRRAIPVTAVRTLGETLSPTDDNPSQNRAGLVAEDAVETPPRPQTREG